MVFKRLRTQIRFWLYGGSGRKRAAYAKKKKLFAEIGEGVQLPAALPLYPKLIRIHNNVVMHRSVQLVTHDMLNSFLSNASESYHFKNRESLCPIEIYDNVFIGMNSIITGNVRIGPNVIINAGSLVTSDIPPNSIVSGVPAKVVGAMDKYAMLRVMMDKKTPYVFKRSGPEMIDESTTEAAWNRFDSMKKLAEPKA